MRKLVLTFGLIAGLIVPGIMSIAWSFNETHSFDGGEIVGYSSMIIAFSTIFVAVKSYRDNHLGGVITFGQGFKIGIYITLIASALYVLWWMIYSNTVYTTFMEDYAKYSLEKLQSSGASPAAIDAARKEMQEFMELYKNPFIKVGMTFIEIFPVGLVISLLSAVILRKKEVLPA